MKISTSRVSRSSAGHSGTLLATTCILVLASCAHQTEISNEKVVDAITHHLSSDGSLCLSPRRWPVDVTEAELRLEAILPTGRARQMAALEAAGLIKAEPLKVDVSPLGALWGNQGEIRRYALTSKAESYAREVKTRSVTSPAGQAKRKIALCWGSKRLDRIIHWRAPQGFGHQAEVTYTYRLDSVAEWALNPAVQDAFPEVRDDFELAGVQRVDHVVKLGGRALEAHTSE